MNSPLALGYPRVSTDRQDLSVEAQTEQIRRAAEYHQLADLELFPESDVSGGIPFAERPAGQRLLERLRRALELEHRPVTVIVAKLDRLGRDTVDIRNTVKAIEQMGDPGERTRILFLDLNVDSRTPIGRLIITVVAACAEMELARIRERIQTALDHKRTKNELTGTVPYGWDAELTGEKTAKGVPIRRMVANPAEQRWILRMCQLRSGSVSDFLAGVVLSGYHTVAKELNRLGCPTKRRGEVMRLRLSHPQSAIGNRQLDRRFTSGKWQAGNVQGVLTNATVRAWLQHQVELQQAA